MTTPHEHAVRAAFHRYIELFNGREFFEAHEVLEEVWLKDHTGDRLFLQGLIQVAASLHHLSRGKLRAARKTLGRARLKFEDYPEIHWDLDITRLVQESARAIDDAGTGDFVETPPPVDPPRIPIQETGSPRGGESTQP